MRQVSDMILLCVIRTQQHRWEVLQVASAGLGAHPAKGHHCSLGVGKWEATLEGKAEQKPLQR